MWLLPFFSPFANLAVRTFYRLTVSGGRVPRNGPVLLVANHPNSLMDPALVAAVAGRPVRFLAKAPLFTDPKVGFLVRGSGAIPVYRAHDESGPKVATQDTFRAVHAALAEGAAVGIFPEGMSHSEPSLAPLKTGAARIALGAAELLRGAFPIVPVGLTFREKETFRSEALAIVGDPVEWGDLAGRGQEPGAVRELTARIAASLQSVTLNLERWEDAPLVELAEAVYAAELPADPSPAARVARLKETTEALARVRRDEPEVYEELARSVGRHLRALTVLRMTPAELKADTGMTTAAKWAARQLTVLRTLLPVAAIGMIVYWVPYRLTGWLEARARPLKDVRATYKALTGIALHTTWTLLLAAGMWWWRGWQAGLLALAGLPVLAYLTMVVVDMWRQAHGEARRFLLRTRRAEALAELRERQRALALRLNEVWEGLRART